jgi:hypothetical protein
VADLDGVWRVRRTGGLLPPLIGVRKEIRGSRGETKVGRFPGVPFDVRDHALHYRGLLAGFVDELEPAGDGYRGRVTFRGREFGRFVLLRTGK